MSSVTAPTPSRPSPLVIDVSHWQGNINWPNLAKLGVVAAFIKATNGAFQPDATYARNITGARAAGIKVGSYHFMLSGQDPEAQADKFLSTIAGHSQDLLPALDCEWDLKGKHDRWLDVPQKVRVAMIGRYILHIRRALGVNPIIYTATSWWRPMIGATQKYDGDGSSANFGDCPLWIAVYTKNPPLLLNLPAPWNRWTIWQRTGTGQLPSIKGDIDMDVLNVPLEALSIERNKIVLPK